MILSSADILRILGGSEIIRLSAKLKIVDGKPPLSGAEGLFIFIDRFPFADEFQATWTIYIESDGSEPDDLVIAEIKKLLPGVKVKPGLMTTVTTTDFLSDSTEKASEAPNPIQAKVDLTQYERRFQELVEGVQDQMLLVTSGRAGRDGKDGLPGAPGRDGKDIDATETEVFDLKDADQSVLPMEKGQVLTWDGSKWTNLYIPDRHKIGGGGGSSDAGVTQIVAGTNVTIDPADGTGLVTISSSGGGVTDVDGGDFGPLPNPDAGDFDTGSTTSTLAYPVDGGNFDTGTTEAFGDSDFNGGEVT